ncbi:hypothetical protein BpHYR1_052241 [Brachionus plicatilis]|uniref:60S ribosomal protein L41 n=1 Tax=Brachionus plicatilis TaxID=10195 RepID=A0A3M7TA18_BRAPC|nr:hypothetical protein BpHYR1_052241 [Brachionus plicatilis]
MNVFNFKNRRFKIEKNFFVFPITCTMRAKWRKKRMRRLKRKRRRMRQRAASQFENILATTKKQINLVKLVPKRNDIEKFAILSTNAELNIRPI